MDLKKKIFKGKGATDHEKAPKNRSQCECKTDIYKITDDKDGYQCVSIRASVSNPRGPWTPPPLGVREG